MHSLKTGKNSKVTNIDKKYYPQKLSNNQILERCKSRLWKKGTTQKQIYKTVSVMDLGEKSYIPTHNATGKLLTILAITKSYVLTL